MKKFVFFLCFIFMITCFPLGLIVGNFSTDTPEKTGYASESIEGYKPISTVAELKAITQDLYSNYYLTKDIEITETNVWSPIGMSITNVVVHAPFVGKLDGKGYKISGLKLSSTFGPTTLSSKVGLFSALDGATVTNLNIEISSLDVHENIEGVSSINIGGLAGEASSSTIKQCAVTLAEGCNEIVETSNSFNFGGIVGNATNGTILQNSYAIVDTQITKDMSQGVNALVGGIVGDITNSKIYNCYSDSKINFVGTGTNPEIKICLGGLVGSLRGNNTEVKNNYALFDLTTNDIISAKGIAIAKIDDSLTPSALNINYNHGYASCMVDEQNTNLLIVGQKGYYDVDTCYMTALQENDFSIFTELTYWSDIYYWDYENVWSENSADFPTLQIFKSYTVELNTNPSVDFGTLQAEDVATIRFADSQELSRTYRFGDVVEIKITIDSRFTDYYELDSIMLATSIVYGAGSTSQDSVYFTVTPPVEDEEEPLNSTNYYLLSYSCNDKTEGQISFSLKKISYTLRVETENISMGKVRNQYSTTTTESFEQTVSYGNTYNFFALAVSNNFAFSNWKFDYADEEVEDRVIESNLSNFSFTFGKEDESTENYNEYILTGAKLVAQWTTNICKVEVAKRLKNGDTVDGCVVKTEDGTVVTDELSFAKGKEYILVATLNDGYEFEGWYDNSGRLLSNSLTLKYTPDEEEDSMTVIARVVKVDSKNNLTWLWILLGSVGLLSIVAVVVVVIVKKSKNNSYKNYY